MIQPEAQPVAPQDEIRERSKLEGRNIEGDDTHTSQPSTIGSLGNLEEQKTPTSSKMQQIEKLGMEIGQKLRKKTQTQVKSIRSMILRVFGEKVDPVRDVDAATRVLLERLNEDIRKLPKRKERIIEGEGQGPIIQALPESFPNPLGTISEMGTKLAHHMPHHMPSINEMRDKISQHMPNVKKELNDVEDAAMHQLEHLKQKFVQTFGEKVNPAKDLDQSVKDKLTRLNEDIRKIPRRNETVIETKGTAEETKEHLLFWGLDHLAYNR